MHAIHVRDADLRQNCSGL